MEPIEPTPFSVGDKVVLCDGIIPPEPWTGRTGTVVRVAPALSWTDDTTVTIVDINGTRFTLGDYEVLPQA